MVNQYNPLMGGASPIGGRRIIKGRTWELGNPNLDTQAAPIGEQSSAFSDKMVRPKNNIFRPSVMRPDAAPVANVLMGKLSNESMMDPMRRKMMTTTLRSPLDRMPTLR
jgi:hypothetical protein